MGGRGPAAIQGAEKREKKRLEKERAKANEEPKVKNGEVPAIMLARSNPMQHARPAVLQTSPHVPQVSPRMRANVVDYAAPRFHIGKSRSDANLRARGNSAASTQYRTAMRPPFSPHLPDAAPPRFVHRMSSQPSFAPPEQVTAPEMANFGISNPDHINARFFGGNTFAHTRTPSAAPTSITSGISHTSQVDAEIRSLREELRAARDALGQSESRALEQSRAETDAAREKNGRKNNVGSKLRQWLGRDKKAAMQAKKKTSMTSLSDQPLMMGHGGSAVPSPYGQTPYGQASAQYQPEVAAIPAVRPPLLQRVESRPVLRPESIPDLPPPTDPYRYGRGTPSASSSHANLAAQASAHLSPAESQPRQHAEVNVVPRAHPEDPFLQDFEAPRPRPRQHSSHLRNPGFPLRPLSSRRSSNLTSPRRTLTSINEERPTDFSAPNSVDPAEETMTSPSGFEHAAADGDVFTSRPFSFQTETQPLRAQNPNSEGTSEDTYRLNSADRQPSRNFQANGPPTSSPHQSARRTHQRAISEDSRGGLREAHLEAGRSSNASGWLYNGRELQAPLPEPSTLVHYHTLQQAKDGSIYCYDSPNSGADDDHSAPKARSKSLGSSQTAQPLTFTLFKGEVSLLRERSDLPYFVGRQDPELWSEDGDLCISFQGEVENAGFGVSEHIRLRWNDSPQLAAFQQLSITPMLGEIIRGGTFMDGPRKFICELFPGHCAVIGADIEYLFRFAAPASLLTDEDAALHNMTTRNVFAVFAYWGCESEVLALPLRNLVGRSVLQTLTDLVLRFKQWFEKWAEAVAHLCRYVFLLGLDHVTDDPSRALALLIWSEREDVHFQQGYAHAFLHCVGMYPRVVDEPLFRHLSQHTADQLHADATALQRYDDVEVPETPSPRAFTMPASPPIGPPPPAPAPPPPPRSAQRLLRTPEN